MYVQDILQKVKIEVNETGSEVAAATVQLMANKCLSMPKKRTLDFFIEGAFLFILFEKTTKTVISMGEISNPELILD